ncbi:hypothetical protein QZH41_005423 [Actinostola sp. cb2023]|nr:hypothetical protein QZH41_005423 [Actinostola sp. cb2023]
MFLSLVSVELSFLLIYTLKDEITSIKHVIQTSYCFNAAKVVQNKQHNKLVLFYTPWFGRTTWPHDGISSWNLTKEDGKPCSHNCLITYNKCDLPRSDAVVFHAVDTPVALALKRIAHLHRNHRQRWIYFTHENPYNVKHDTAPYNGIFNWTVSYRRDSDVFYPDGYFREIETAKDIPKDHSSTNYANGKDKLIAWAVSHCGRLRDKVVHKLLKFVPVTVFGRCDKLFNQNIYNKCKRGTERCSSLLKTFKFYLAFENEMCFDYITEKYWDTPFLHNMIPIVMGSNYDAQVAIPGSFINVLDFPSIEALANYIKYLDKNDTAYNEYFQWKTKYKRWKGNSWTCQLCANLHNDSLPKKVYHNLGTFWGIHSSCNSNEVQLRRLIG